MRFLTILVLAGFNIKVGMAQMFTRSCQDPLIQNHQNVFGHTFCYHSCGYELNAPNPVGLEVCTANGICQCNYACDTLPPTVQYGNQCPSFSSDPPDPNPLAGAMCSASCAGLCAGGQGMICGEVYGQGLGPNMDIWAKICTCYCPPQPCTTTTTTTTTPAPVTTTMTQLLFPFPVYLPFVKKAVKKKLIGGWKLLGWKALIKLVLIIKLVCMFLLKIVFITLYFHKYSPPPQKYGWERF